MEAKDQKTVKALSISSLIVGALAMLSHSWWLGLAAIVLAFFLYYKQANKVETKKYFIMAIIAAIFGCIGIVESIVDMVEQKKRDEMQAKNESFTADMENYLSELSTVTIENENVKINGGITKFFKVKSISIEPKEIFNNSSKSITTEELNEDDFTQKWTAKILFERSGIKLPSNSDTYYTGEFEMVFEDETGYPISETKEKKYLSKEDFYKSIGETLAFEYSFKLGKGKEKDALSKIKSLNIDSELEKGSHYQDNLKELQNAVKSAAKTTNGDSGNAKGNDWDSVLDDYESYVDNYISLYKKAMKGDMSALSEYQSMMQKAQSLSKKLEKAGNTLTAAQASRYQKITMKMANAIK